MSLTASIPRSKLQAPQPCQAGACVQAYSYVYKNSGPKFDGHVSLLEEYIENLVEDKRASERATRKLKFGSE